LSAPQAASLRIVDASRGVARRRDGGRSAAPSVGLPSASCSVGWASLWRAGRRPCVSGRRLRDVDRRGCGRPLLLRSGTSARPESSRPQGSGVSGLRDAEILGRAPTGERCRTACYILHAEDYLKYFGEGWRGGLPTSARLYAGELEELYRRSLKGLFSKVERLSDSTEGALSAAGEGGSPGSASTRSPWRFCRLPPRRASIGRPCPQRSLGPTAKRGRPSGLGGGLAGGPTAAVRGSVGRLSAASADVADRRPGGGGGVR
jgi:hypothetical protein